MAKSTEVYINQGNRFVYDAIPGKARTILDLGCGGANIGKTIANNKFIWDGVTISESEAQIAKQHYQDVFVHNLENGLPIQAKERPYDVCICSHVLEHIAWPKQLFSDIRSVLIKSNGTLIVALPNALYYDIRLKFLRGKFQYRDSGILDINHLRWYTFASGKQLLENQGFTITNSGVEGKFPLSKKIRNSLPVKLIHAVDKFWGKRIPGLFGFQMIYVAKVNSMK
jgi:SAM-dependent methyltransferase